VDSSLRPIRIVAPYLVLGVLTFAFGTGVARETSVLDGLLPAQAATVATAEASVPTPMQMLIADGRTFSIVKPGDADVSLTVPSGVVLTDARISYSIPASFPNAAALIIADEHRTFVYQLMNDTTFEASVHLQSGIASNGTLTVRLFVLNISNNQVQGAIMWSGYRG
jgi:hypothetical protein